MESAPGITTHELLFQRPALSPRLQQPLWPRRPSIVQRLTRGLSLLTVATLVIGWTLAAPSDTPIVIALAMVAFVLVAVWRPRPIRSSMGFEAHRTRRRGRIVADRQPVLLAVAIAQTSASRPPRIVDASRVVIPFPLPEQRATGNFNRGPRILRSIPPRRPPRMRHTDSERRSRFPDYGPNRGNDHLPPGAR